MLSCNTKPCCPRHCKGHLYLLAKALQPWDREARIARCEAYIDSMTKVSKAPFCTELLEQILGQSTRHSDAIIPKHGSEKCASWKDVMPVVFCADSSRHGAKKAEGHMRNSIRWACFWGVGHVKKGWRLSNHEDGLKKPYAHSWYLYTRVYLDGLSIGSISELNTMHTWIQRLPWMCRR